MSERRNHYYIDGSTVRKLDYSAEPVRREYEPARRTEIPAERLKGAGGGGGGACKIAVFTEKVTGINHTGAGCQTERQKMGR